MSLSVTVRSSIADIPQEAWGRLASGHGIYLSHPWLASVERSRLSDGRYVTVTRGGTLVGVLPLYLVGHEENRAYNVHASFLSGCSEEDRWYPSLLAGTRTAYRNALLVDHGLPLTEQCDVTRALLDQARDIAGDVDARSLIFWYLSQADLALLDLVCGKTSSAFLAAFDMTIPVRGLTEREYHDRLGRHRRQTLRAERRRFERCGYTVECLELAEFADEGGGLVAHLCRTHGTPMTDERGRAYLADIASSLPGRSVAFVARHADGSAAACSVCLVDDERVYARTYGFRQGPALRSGEYFMLCYTLPTALAIGRGLDALHLGAGNPRPKLLRGACPEMLWTVCFDATDHPADLARSQRQEAIASWLEQCGDLLPAVPDPAGLAGSGSPEGLDQREQHPWLRVPDLEMLR